MLGISVRLSLIPDFDQCLDVAVLKVYLLMSLQWVELIVKRKEARLVLLAVRMTRGIALTGVFRRPIFQSQ